ncbi:MAG: peptidoglycan D,D-transpeptidase FtsI family protein [Oscillospiraceae bacterium]
MIQPYLADRETYYKGIQGKLPFLCEVTGDAYDLGDEAIIFRSSVRTDSNQLAPHLIGYTSDNKGVYGIEKAFDDFLRDNFSVNSAKFQIDAVGSVLNGLEKEVAFAEPLECGIITTIDKNIQQICENAAKSLNRGAIVVMDVKSGEIKAMVSCPDFDTTDIEASLDDPESPFVNRALSAYSVGSIFKLVTAAAAIEQGISPEYSYSCTGSIDVNGQIFNCHKWGGHGEIDMDTAIVQSCNTYFIALSEYLDKNMYIETAEKLGFGKGIKLCDNIISAAGTIQTEKDLAVEAERANMSFGQGKLTATPLQICRMTAAIANDGVINTPVLIKGIRNNDGTTDYCSIETGERVLSYETAKKLKLYMLKTVRAENSMSDPEKTIAAGKTSTAQTGKFNDNGNEILNCWFTGYFPSYSPRYAVTVLVEDGISGNVSAGPIFKEIADEITEYEKCLRK